MKRIASLFCTVLILLSICTIPASAHEECSFSKNHVPYMSRGSWHWRWRSGQRYCKVRPPAARWCRGWRTAAWAYRYAPSPKTDFRFPKKSPFFQKNKKCVSPRTSGLTHFCHTICLWSFRSSCHFSPDSAKKGAWLLCNWIYAETPHAVHLL